MWSANFFFVVVALMLMPMAASAGTEHSVNPDIGTHTWKRTSDSVTYSLTQILPDQLRAFYAGRGFPADVIESYATSCVFMTVVRNDHEDGEITFSTSNWSLATEGTIRPLKGTRQWLSDWLAQGVMKPQLIAFEWAQFPTQQSYQPGDWNQGMLAMNLSAGESFNLNLEWMHKGKVFKGILEEVRCAS